ncbi:DNA repair protein RecO [Subsaximicrobium wynnwilliamsii]|uniref:DNA repair protein RecO n=1 Tax=Subsaximicrobium wynnwilliamsii TaxID=291179 RepID=A0A5C6ZF43_9FLAO|nr:DNA repair protein RecO [Subsaximicrobium wynnwilliamsii]TXD82182.1 DNA repair protein RecO [Subsaximicrobium wynnwilliamsii]TXD87822.1 DNA repair protein RecO [Subsaximicrobium wynnwilliamsii]TXE01772.1 DNA repair protein RecO [Subsaximicrobium wynnwilliamsii]
MLIKTKAIVLSKIKYRDNDLIVKCYTQQKGIVSYLLRGVLKSKKGSSKSAYYQLLSQIELESSYKANQSLQYINEVKIAYVYKSLQTNILKTAIVMFLSEVLSSVLKEEEQNLELFDYIETTLQWLDLQEEFSNFHLLFLLELTKHLGFYPDTSDVNQRYFNLNNGLFQSNKLDVYSISGENLDILSQLLFVDFESLETVKLNAKQRQSFLTMLLLYYELHLGSFKKPQSLDIFNQVFH